MHSFSFVGALALMVRAVLLLREGADGLFGRHRGRERRDAPTVLSFRPFVV
jgi:hypothetical protein